MDQYKLDKRDRVAGHSYTSNGFGTLWSCLSCGHVFTGTAEQLLAWGRTTLELCGPKKPLAEKPQTLLEAAKAFGEAFDLPRLGSRQACDLRAAIAREEAKQSVDEFRASVAREQIALDRAQQAEASAAWHKAESERLSAELAKTKEFRSYAEEAANFGGKWRDRAEDAEAKVRNLQRQNREAIDERDLLRLRTATIDNLRQRAEKAEAELAMMGKQLARLVELQVNPPIMVAHPFEGDPQTCAFGSNAFGGNREVSETDDDYEDPVDPTTGFTFATYRRLLEALGGKS